jgi:hypothetical protein
MNFMLKITLRKNGGLSSLSKVSFICQLYLPSFKIVVQ